MASEPIELYWFYPKDSSYVAKIAWTLSPYIHLPDKVVRFYIFFTSLTDYDRGLFTTYFIRQTVKSNFSQYLGVDCRDLAGDIWWLSFSLTVDLMTYYGA